MSCDIIIVVSMSSFFDVSILDTARVQGAVSRSRKNNFKLSEGCQYYLFAYQPVVVNCYATA